MTLSELLNETWTLDKTSFLTYVDREDGFTVTEYDLGEWDVTTPWCDVLQPIFLTMEDACAYVDRNYPLGGCSVTG